MDNIVMFLIIFHSWLRLSKAHQETHYLHYLITAKTKTDPFTVFSGVCESDDKQIAYYSNEKGVWVRRNLTDWAKAPEPPETREEFINLLYNLSKCTPSPECPELHVLQKKIGCELEKLNGTVKSFNVFNEKRFDGEDFISFNNHTMQWIDKNSKAKETKEEWDHQTERNQYIKDFFKNCFNWISTFNNTIKSSPHVHIFARKAPDDHSNLVLTCLATGFYPRDVQMNIRLNRNILDNQTSSGIRPNDDETFQMRISVKINRNHEGSYDCLLIHSSLTEPVSVKWGKYHYKFSHSQCCSKRMSRVTSL
ncbi:major histocompatibility complex class I-related gene protein-like [Megalobrama amblycephala]|uniref:major histocompatibility complex class I-related gene protein-like n=1 Tax=Megalobrama amblycephala TaxID=75352 RepID=UPI0020148315|nr:major histocompatibility complex class I-related gene protein-like [Megalobrama amblycephala]